MLATWQVVGPSRAILCDLILDPTSAPDVMVSFIPGQADAFMQPDRAAVIYWAPVDAATGETSPNWSLLGALHGQSPSQLFRTGWSAGALQGFPLGTPVRLAVSLEPMTVAANLGLGAGGEAVEERRAFAAAIARDLWNFLGSFSQPNPYANQHQHQQQHQQPAVQSNGEMMLVPTNILDRWLERFNAKFSRDPNFMMKKTEKG